MKIKHRTYQEQRQAYDKIRDVIAGEDRLKNQSTVYLPQPEGMTQQQYTRYLTGSSFYAVAERTLRGMVGSVTRNEPILDLPPRIEPMRDAATFEGNSFNVLLEDAAINCCAPVLSKSVSPSVIPSRLAKSTMLLVSMVVYLLWLD